MARNREELRSSTVIVGQNVRLGCGTKRRVIDQSAVFRTGPSSKRMRSMRRSFCASSTTHTTSRVQFGALTDDLLLEIFKKLLELPHILAIRQVCRRWYILSCSPRLWRSLSFGGQEHVTSINLEALCKSTPALRKLRTLSLAKVHGVSDYAVRNIPRTCAATLESVDLSWCSGATDKSVVEFSRCPGLRELRLSHCRMVTRRSVRILAVRCPRLEVLDMNCMSGVRDSLLVVVGSNCPFLRVLKIANARNVTDDGVAHVTRGCPRIEVLDLSWCSRVTDWSILKIAHSSPHLRDLRLSETRVTDVGLSEVARCCKRVDVLHLARCMYVTSTGIGGIITHCGDRLKSVNLASCENVSDLYVERLILSCPALECLDVSKLPCREISGMLERITESRSIQVYF